nr:immunoglobulin light chain junction region [Macaca mulatta]
CMQHKTLPWTF